MSEDRKTEKVSKKDLLRLQRMDALSDEDKQTLRLKNIKTYERQIDQIKRELEFKEEQIKTNILLETHDGFVNKKKPIFFLKNEIDNGKAHVEQLEEQIKGAQEEYDKAKEEVK